MRSFALILILAAASACSSAAPSSLPSDVASAFVPTPDERPEKPPAVKMTSGVEVVQGVVASWCAGDECPPVEGAAPKRFLKADASGLIVFATGVVPAAARIEVTGAGAEPQRRALTPGTTMASQLRLPAGRFVVTLIQTWPGREGRWLFGLTGPAGG